MKKYIAFTLLLMMLLLGACKNDEPSEVPNKDNANNEDDRKKLVFLVHEDLLPSANVDEAIYTEFNKLLREKGVDCKVEFIGFDPMEVQKHQSDLLNMKKEGKQIDLFMTGFGNEEIDSNIEAVKNELLVPLDDYLQSEKGQQLYNQFDEKVWERIKIDQTIYGLVNNSELYYPNALFINKEVIEDLGLKAPKKINELDQLDALLEDVSKQSDDIVPFAFSGFDVRGLTGYSFFESGIAVDYDNNEMPFAFNPFDVPEVKTLLKTFEAFANKGYWISGEEANERVNHGKFFSQVTDLTPLTYVDDILHLGEGRSVNALSYKLSDDFIEPTLNGMTGIASWSENKEEALELLTLINTDADLSNLLYHGIEGKHYKLEDGVASVVNEETRAPGFFSPANRMIVYPNQSEPKNKADVLKDWLSSARLSPRVGFELNQDTIANELAAVQSVYDKYWDLWMVRGIDVKAKLDEVNRELKDAGINQVLDEINRQLEESWEKDL